MPSCRPVLQSCQLLQLSCCNKMPKDEDANNRSMPRLLIYARSGQVKFGRTSHLPVLPWLHRWKGNSCAHWMMHVLMVFQPRKQHACTDVTSQYESDVNATSTYRRQGPDIHQHSCCRWRPQLQANISGCRYGIVSAYLLIAMQPSTLCAKISQ